MYPVEDFYHSTVVRAIEVSECYGSVRLFCRKERVLKLVLQGLDYW